MSMVLGTEIEGKTAPGRRGGQHPPLSPRPCAGRWSAGALARGASAALDTNTPHAL